ncbi:MAG: hypothetical protein K1X72_03415 [Pyrinomonadaceae bacterium]|nr:hypothetical protein [Pyrinomonadaceae bacterium]
MKQIILIIAFTLLIGIVQAFAATDYCFENEGLKGTTLITFSISGNKVTDGEFSFSEYDSKTSSETYDFKGIKTGNTLTIKFDRTVPQTFSHITKLIWTLGTKTLKVQMYGKNYETNKWSVYSATLSKCKG